MHKPLNTKINIKYYRLLDAMHKKSDIPKSRLIERSLELMAKHLNRRAKADALLEAIEEGERDYAEGRTKSWDQLKSEIEHDIIVRKSKK